MKNKKLLKVANVRERMDAHYRGEISYSRAVELLNEDANKALAIDNASDSRQGEICQICCGELDADYGNVCSECDDSYLED